MFRFYCRLARGRPCAGHRQRTHLRTASRPPLNNAPVSKPSSKQQGGTTLAADVAALDASLPALHDLPAADLSRFLDTLDELIHADGRVTTDGTVRVGEVELLRAFASALDCPMPALAA